MGMYGEVEIIATYETEEQADKVFESLEENIKKHIESKIDTRYDFRFTECDLDGESIIIKVCSDRYQNAQWQGEETFEFMKTTDGLVEFTADIIMPDNFIFWNADDED